MDPNTREVAHEFLPLFRIYKDGTVERHIGEEFLPPSDDPQTGIQSKDVIVSPENGLSARLFIPKITNPSQKFPLLIYVHGGAFSIQSPFSPLYHNHLTSLVNKANVVAVSIQYRRAPDHPLPTAYEDSWEAIKWVASHVTGNGPEQWLNRYADFERLFMMGDSAGANIVHNMAIRVGVDGLVSGVRLVGIVLMHPFFRNNEPDKLIDFIFPTSKGPLDPRMNPAGAGGPEMERLGCSRVLVCVAGDDKLRDRGVSYYEALKKSGWVGVVEIVETEGEDHVFHLFKPDCDKVEPLMEKVVSFINQD